MIKPTISNNVKKSERGIVMIRGTMVWAIRNLQYKYLLISPSGYIRFGTHEPDTGVCAITIDVRLLGFEKYLEKGREFLEDIKVNDPALYSLLREYLDEKFKEDMLSIFY